jgi:hypothetical protein
MSATHPARPLRRRARHRPRPVDAAAVPTAIGDQVGVGLRRSQFARNDRQPLFVRFHGGENPAARRGSQDDLLRTGGREYTGSFASAAPL